MSTTNKPIYFDKVFEDHYQKRILKDKKLHELFKIALVHFIENPNHPRLRNHELKGRMSSKRAFTIDKDCRVIYIADENAYIFLDIGTHDEVYQ